MANEHKKDFESMMKNNKKIRREKNVFCSSAIL